VQNNLVLNLPHGMDGQGPEHSSARMERYLQMMNDNWTNLIVNNEISLDLSGLRHSNMSVICCSTAANIFHSLRRQMRRDYRRPLIHFVNKKLLKLREAGTTFAELNRDRFDTIIDDYSVDPQQVKKVVLLYGQAYYSALEKRTQLERKVISSLLRT
jgi:2-oxoglutarate dehydrogenase E1 component